MKLRWFALSAPQNCLRGITLTAAVCLALAGAIPAMAGPITYDYTGNDFNSFGFTFIEPPVFYAGEYITASITLASPLDLPNPFYGLVDGGLVLTNPADCADLCGDLVSWSIGDGTDALSSANGNFLETLEFNTDAEGQISSWSITAFASGYDVYQIGRA